MPWVHSVLVGRVAGAAGPLVLHLLQVRGAHARVQVPGELVLESELPLELPRELLVAHQLCGDRKVGRHLVAGHLAREPACDRLVVRHLRRLR